MPAWALSLALHALVLIGLGWTLRPPAPGNLQPEPRAVGIVVATAPAEPRQPYSRPDPAESEASAARSTAATSADESDPAAAGNFLPAADAAPAPGSPELQLPRPDLPAWGGSALVPDLDLGRRGHRPKIAGSGDDPAIWQEEAARQAARQALGPATQVSVFGSTPAAGRSFVFAIDRSHSMGGDGLNALAAARTELARAIGALQDNHRFQIVAYHHQCLYLQGARLLAATEEHQAAVAPFIENLAALGGTGHETAVRVALALEPDAMFLLTDGGDPYLNEIQLANLRKLAAGRTAIHTIQFGFGPAPAVPFMRALAEQNRGSYTYVDMSPHRGP